MIAFKVTRPNRKRAEIVDADYFRVGERGEVVFRNVNRDTEQGYPIFVKCYAAGAWLAIDNAVPLCKGQVR